MLTFLRSANSMVNVKIYRLRCAMSVSPFIKNMKSSSKETKDII